MEQCGEDLHLQFLVFSRGSLEWQDLEHILEHLSIKEHFLDHIKMKQKFTMSIQVPIINNIVFTPPPQEVRNVWVDIRIEPWKSCLLEMNISWTKTCIARHPRKLPCANDGKKFCMYCKSRIKSKGIYVIQNSQEKKDVVYFLAGHPTFSGKYASLIVK